MAIQLPKYQKQVGVSGETGQVGIDPQAATAPLRAATKAIDVATDMGVEFASKIKEHKDKGDVAGYKNRANQLDDQVEVAKQKGMLQGYKGEELFEKSIAPVLEQFESDINSADYSKQVKELAYADFNSRVNGVYAGFEADQLAESIELANLELISLATELEARGENADDVWSQVQKPPAEIARERSKATVGIETASMRQLWLDYNDNLITDDELRKELEASNKRVKENDNILAFHKNEYEKESLGKVTSIARKRKLNESKYISEAKSLDKSGKLDGPELEQIERVMGPEYVGSLLKLNYESMKRGAVSDKDMGKAFALVNEFINTPDMDFYKAIKRSEKIGGKAGRRAFWQMSEIYKERIDKDVEVGTPLQSYRTDFFEQVTRFVATGDKKGDWYDDRMLRFDKWVEKNPDAEIEDYYDFRYKELKTDVAEFVGKYNAPQMTTQDAGLPDFDNMTDEELEAYLNE